MQTKLKKPQKSSKLELLSREMKSPTMHCRDMAQFESKRKKKAQEIRNKARNQRKM